MLKSAVWFITEKCNMSCPYCLEKEVLKRFITEKEITPEQWADAWNRLQPATLDITGGEPLLVPGFVSILEKLNKSIRIAITSNVKCDLTEFALKISPDQVFSMTLSLHPSQMDFQRFIGKALFLKNRGFNLTINFVSYPEQLWLIPSFEDACARLDLKFHVDYYVTNDGKFDGFPYNQNEQGVINRYIGQDRSHFLEAKSRPVICSAGIDHIQVFPDGQAFRCMKEMMSQEKGSIGNILAEDFRLCAFETLCDDANKCAGCDRDKVTIKDDRKIII
jgi:hypothetical protein